MKSSVVEEETVVQNPGSSLWAGFFVSGLLRSLVGFRVSSSSRVFMDEKFKVNVLRVCFASF
jgi:hypothetical protein